MKYIQVFQTLGLALNEARILEALFTNGELNISKISEVSGINRRNIYDSLSRLTEKGLVSSVLDAKENTYRAEHPEKLLEILMEKETELNTILPELIQLHGETPPEASIRVYRGEEGWKNFMLDVIRTQQNVKILGAKGALASDSLHIAFSLFKKKADKGNIEFQVLYDWQVKDNKSVLGHLGSNYKIMPEIYSTDAAVAIYGPNVIIFRASPVEEKTRKEYTFVSISDEGTARAFESWFQFIWNNCPEN